MCNFLSEFLPVINQLMVTQLKDAKFIINLDNQLDATITYSMK